MELLNGFFIFFVARLGVVFVVFSSSSLLSSARMGIAMEHHTPEDSNSRPLLPITRWGKRIERERENRENFCSTILRAFPCNTVSCSFRQSGKQCQSDRVHASILMNQGNFEESSFPPIYDSSLFLIIVQYLHHALNSTSSSSHINRTPIYIATQQIFWSINRNIHEASERKEHQDLMLRNS